MNVKNEKNITKIDFIRRYFGDDNFCDSNLILKMHIIFKKIKKK
jgi:hypothetical protein